MYRRPKFLEVLIEIRQEMAREADYDVDLFAEQVRRGTAPKSGVRRSVAVPSEKAKTAARKKPSKRKPA
jgi:hypothetical protein